MTGLELDVVDDSVRLLFHSAATLEEVASGGTWFEGPAWLGTTLVWSDVVGNRLHAWDRTRGARVWIDPSFHQNGHTVDRQGRLLAASHGERAVVRLERDGRWTIVADLIDGARFHSPNDLVVASDGAVWFTDPRYGLDKPTEGFGGSPEIDGTHVYRVDPRGMVGGVRNVTRHAPPMPAPNGLAFSPDESVLYIADSEARHILGFVVRISLDGPELGRRWVVHETIHGWPDGIRVDPTGRIWSSSTAGVEILAPPSAVGRPARHLGTLHTPFTTANLAFSPDLATLALTATSSVFLVRLGDVSV